MYCGQTPKYSFAKRWLYEREMLEYVDGWQTTKVTFRVFFVSIAGYGFGYTASDLGFGVGFRALLVIMKGYL